MLPAGAAEVCRDCKARPAEFGRSLGLLGGGGAKLRPVVDTGFMVVVLVLAVVLELPGALVETDSRCGSLATVEEEVGAALGAGDVVASLLTLTVVGPREVCPESLTELGEAVGSELGLELAPGAGLELAGSAIVVDEGRTVVVLVSALGRGPLDEAGSPALAAGGFASGLRVAGFAVVVVLMVVEVVVVVVVVELGLVLDSNDDGLLGGADGTTATKSAAASSFLVGGEADAAEIIGVTGPLVDLSGAALLGALATSVMTGSDLLDFPCSCGC